MVACLALLAGCAGPRGIERDGPEANPPRDLDRVPDAEPRLEPIRPGGPNKPYNVFGRDYVPMTQDVPFAESGLASWYGRKFNGKPTSSGEPYDMYAMTAAHPTLPIPSYARVRNPRNGRQVIVRINDRGPFHSTRVIDLSYTAALKLDLLRGVAPVDVERITFEDIRTGAWRQGAMPIVAQSPAPAPVVVPEAVVASVAAAPADGPPPAGFWVQLGAFRIREGAQTFQQRVAAEFDWLSPVLAVVDDAALFKLQAGPYASRDEARGVADRVREAMKLVPVIVERR